MTPALGQSGGRAGGIVTGTTTTAETLAKAASRVTGTLAGLGAAVLAAEATAGHTTTAIVVILVCVALGFYLNKVSYALMIFFITIMIAQLYSLLHEFSTGLLVLRLEETAIGAGIGAAVTLLILPISTRTVARSAQSAFVASLHDLLDAAAARLRPGASGPGLIGPSRDLDAKLQQLVLVAEPLTRSLYFGSPREDARCLLSAARACDFYARGLALAIDQPPSAPGQTSGDGENPAAGRAELRRASQALAQACLTLNGNDDPARRQAAAAASDVALRMAARSPAGDPATRYLMRTSEAVIFLAGPRQEELPTAPGSQTPHADTSAHMTPNAKTRRWQ